MFQFSDNEKFSAALLHTGFNEIAVKTAEQIWELDEPSSAIMAFSEGAVRSRALLLAQTEAAKTAIADAVTTGMGPYRSVNGRYRVPMPALIGVGVK